MYNKSNSIFFLVLIAIIISCKTPKFEDFVLDETAFEVYRLPLITGQDTVHLYELRFFDIQSSLDAKAMLYKELGAWSIKEAGKHQDNINLLGWSNIDLLGDGNLYNISGDGKETLHEYFTSFMVLDEGFADCLDPKHPKRKKIIKFLAYKMRYLSNSGKHYDKVR